MVECGQRQRLVTQSPFPVMVGQSQESVPLTMVASG